MVDLAATGCRAAAQQDRLAFRPFGHFPAGRRRVQAGWRRWWIVRHPRGALLIHYLRNWGLPVARAIVAIFAFPVGGAAAGYTDLAMSSSAAHRATLAGQGWAARPRAMCEKSASSASAIAPPVVSGWS